MTHCSKLISLATLVLVVAMGIGTSASAATVKKDGSFYKVKVVTAGTGDNMTATITVTGKKGYHCNMQYPWKLTINQADGVTVDKVKYKKADAATFTEDKVIFKVKYKATDGSKKVTAELKLSLCDVKQCQMEKVKLEWPAK